MRSYRDRARVIGYVIPHKGVPCQYCRTVIDHWWLL